MNDGVWLAALGGIAGGAVGYVSAIAARRGWEMLTDERIRGLSSSSRRTVRRVDAITRVLLRYAAAQGSNEDRDLLIRELTDGLSDSGIREPKT